MKQNEEVKIGDYVFKLWPHGDGIFLRNTHMCQSEVLPKAVVFEMAKLLKGTNDEGKWISVEDKLPSMSSRLEPVIALWVNGNETQIGESYYNRNTNTWDSRTTLYCSPLWKVTHWQPLPEPPGEIQ